MRLNEVSVPFLLFLAHAAAADEQNRVIPEDVLIGWGYRTTSLEATHHIKTIEPLPDRDEKWYPRFRLWRECFDTVAAAGRRKHEVEAEIDAATGIMYKDSRQIIRSGNCLTYVAAGGTFFFLEFQPELIKNLEGYLCGKEDCEPSLRESAIER